MGPPWTRLTRPFHRSLRKKRVASASQQHSQSGDTDGDGLDHAPLPDWLISGHWRRGFRLPSGRSISASQTGAAPKGDCRRRVVPRASSLRMLSHKSPVSDMHSELCLGYPCAQPVCLLASSSRSAIARFQRSISSVEVSEIKRADTTRRRSTSIS